MIYMAAGDSIALDANAVRDLREMERAEIGEDVNVVVQINRSWPSQPQRYRITTGRSSLEQPNVTDENMGDPQTLRNFLTWAEGAYPAESFFLVLWGHAYGLGFGRDHGDPLMLSELRNVLVAFKQRRGKSLELLGANACAMSYLEAAFELSESVDFLVASQISVPFAGWPFDSILSCVGGKVDGRTLGKTIVDRYVNDVSPSSDDRVALTLLNLAGAERLKPLLTDLASAISSVIGESVASAVDRRSQVRTAFMATVAGDIRPLVDAVDLCDELTALCDDLSIIEARADSAPREGSPLSSLKKAADGLKMALASGDTFVAEHRRHPELEELNGVGVFAPFISSEGELERIGLTDTKKDKGRTEYMKLGLTGETKWGELVYDTLRAGLPSDVVACIECASAGSREDQAAVVQMLVSVDSMFFRLDRRVTATRLRVLGQMRSGAAGPVLGGSVGEPFDAIGRFGELRLIDEAALTALLKKATDGVNGKTNAASQKTSPEGVEKAPAPVEVLATTVDALRDLEASLEAVERAVCQTLTNGTFGLGPGPLPVGVFKTGLGLDPKGGMGLLDPKGGMGLLDPKGGMGLLDPKGGMGEESAFSFISVRTAPGAAVTMLFGQMAQALRQLEEAAVGVERASAQALSGFLGTAGLSADRAQTIAVAQVERGFAGLAEASTDARRTLRRILAHPAYGFGRGPAGIGAEDRRELARLGGLNSQALKLL
jgi:hypothetical protein